MPSDSLRSSLTPSLNVGQATPETMSSNLVPITSTPSNDVSPNQNTNVASLSDAGKLKIFISEKQQIFFQRRSIILF